MNICILYHSRYGNGRKCVEHLATTLQDLGHQTQELSMVDVAPKHVPEADLYIFSSPTRFGRPPGTVSRFLKRMSVGRAGLRYTLVATYLDPKTRALEIMERILTRKEMVKMIEGLKLRVEAFKGPLEDGHKTKIETFAYEISAAA